MTDEEVSLETLEDLIKTLARQDLDEHEQVMRAHFNTAVKEQMERLAKAWLEGQLERQGDGKVMEQTTSLMEEYLEDLVKACAGFVAMDIFETNLKASLDLPRRDGLSQEVDALLGATIKLVLEHRVTMQKLRRDGRLEEGEQ